MKKPKHVAVMIVYLSANFINIISVVLDCRIIYIILIVSKNLFVAIFINKFPSLYPHSDPVTVLICGHRSHSRASQLSRDFTADAGFLPSTAVVLVAVLNETPCTICKVSLSW